MILMKLSEYEEIKGEIFDKPEAFEKGQIVAFVYMADCMGCSLAFNGMDKLVKKIKSGRKPKGTMTADEARMLQKKAIDYESVGMAIELINSSIKKSAENGESYADVCLKDFNKKKLKDVERNEIAKHFRSNGFNVEWMSYDVEWMSYDNFFDVRISWL